MEEKLVPWGSFVVAFDVECGTVNQRHCFHTPITFFDNYTVLTAALL